MGQNTILSIGLSRMGWTEKVETDFQPDCWACKKPVDVGRDFYYCKTTQKFWCYPHGARYWDKSCDYDDNHNHFCIRHLEIEKKEVSENDIE